ncbi:excinuclease ABC subunit A [Parabacteroides sp. PF5-5]|uniref:excinuclease ABC subunit UvrA n=1 Tax=unclassified Parabacteroides TaxID=2649774 RepID=UPI002473DBB7|nr:MULTISPECIES: excinuclease ABC subunit UvrA [unclassified Parabacteroides]MDH6305953.1 excinuclease ABC subunit A [Parabacteroides sp. PH5-39]MDH6317209.1 excinuclease ABC subunit A [Parabacteroides sp. PF5-13]MDH6320665.1 excinuclease ABC subunit A [Parabacteroides sp. PH5-13]MDH6324414.1 excinuclease ABC subunit A [Parabacteroides sp. PH5-8]MDH6328394.1 excinuclease ABC subunit A [Parabacteroides sp. PH5-41]
MTNEHNILIKGARVNNLKNIDVEIPRDKLVVITGLSGSGKSSLAFDTLYAEGQRRYVESLSSYARQFLGRMSKPEADYIKGIPPAIAIEQKVSTRNPRSTVGTSTEVYDYLRLLYARIGKTISPVSGKEVKKHQVNDIVRWVLSYPEDTRFAVFAPIVLPEGRSMKAQLEILQKEGYTRLSINDEVYRIQEVLENKTLLSSPVIELLVDRLTVSTDKTLKSRLADSAETAFYEGHDTCFIRVYAEEGTITKEFSKRFEEDGIVFEEPSDMMFSFNNPVGACPVCEGFGKILGIDENLVIPDKSLSVYEGAVVCWKGEVMSEWQRDFINNSAKYDFPIHRAYYDLTEKEKDLLWSGAEGLHGINDFFQFVQENLYKIQYRVMQARYRGKTTCSSCKGSRLKPQALYVQVGGKNIAWLVSLPITELKMFFDNLELDEADAAIAKRLLTEIKNRLQFLLDVGLGYLTLDRLSASLSGGESQRINLATSLGSSLVGSLYILDEPSIGLHSRDTDLLIKVLRQLEALGNTVVVVEHDEEIIRAADYIIDIGPKAGRLGGEVVYQGDVDNLQTNTDSYTVRYLTGEDQIEVPSIRRKWNNYIEVFGARKNNLKGIDVKFPLNVMTVVTGVSGSGKSTLVRDIFYECVKLRLDNSARSNVDCKETKGDFHLIKGIEFVDQNSIGKSTRSNPVTYIGAYDEIRKLFGEQPLAKQLGYTAAYFSFNKEGGRCEECKGEGKITVEMQFMADISLECDVCHGKRFKSDVLDVEYKGSNIYDVLEMTVNQAIEFFGESKDSQAKKIVKRLKPLQDVGLGYIKLGQTSSTLSGGENQRVKLASYLGQETQHATLFVFDEPTTGLHFHDIKTLLKAFNALIDKGHSVVIIEHNMDVIKCADYVIDLGPEGGNAGGNLVCAGTPEDIAACSTSYTGQFLKDKL